MPGSQVEVNDIKNSFERGESKGYTLYPPPQFMSQIHKLDVNTLILLHQVKIP